MVFENVELDYPNITFGPDPGRIYSFDHENDTLVVKTYPGGTTIDIAPLDTNLKNEVISVEYDGFYFFTLTKLGTAGDLGVSIEKWFYDGNIVIKQLGIGNEITLVNGGFAVYDSEAMSVQTYTTELSFTVTSGNTSATFDNVDYLTTGDHVYLGPSNYTAGDREELIVQSIVGNVVTFTTPLQFSYLVGDQVKYLKDIWLYNNYNGTDPDNGSLLRISTQFGALTGIRSGLEWKNVVAATVKTNGDFLFVRGTQLLQYRPFGLNSGFQTSLILVNVKPNKKDIVKVYDITADSTSVLKLQDFLVYFDSGSGDYLTESWDTYNVDREFFANRVFTITHTRDDRSLLFREGSEANFTVKVRDQYDIPVVGRAVTVTETDPVGYIEPGFESFITDSQGEGISRYVTGAGLEHDLPEITVTDVGSSIKSETLFVQIPSIDGDGNIVQVEDIPSVVQVSQEVTGSGITYITQTPFESEMPLVQQTPSGYGAMQLTQIIIDELTYLVQQSISGISEMPLVQSERMTEPIEVQQYKFLIFAIPEPFSTKNPVDTNILVRIVGFGAIPLDPNTLIFKVNGVDVTTNVTITPFAGGFELFYDPPVDFEYLSTVTVEIYILDTDVPPNLISTIYTFETVADYKAPIVTERFPPNFSVNNPSTTDVYGIITDNETGIDTSTIDMFVNGIRVIPTVTEITPGVYKVLYQTTIPYAFESMVSAAIKVQDLAGNEIIDSWNFEIGNSAGILFVNQYPEDCQVLIPVEANICIEAFGKEQGLHIDSTEFEVDGKTVIYALVPKVYRKD